VINQLSKEGLIESEFHAPRRVIRLSPVGRQIAERILEVEKISANLIQNERARFKFSEFTSQRVKIARPSL